MADQNSRIYGWCPSNDYQVHEVTQPALRKRFDHRPRHNKGHVAFKTNDNNEEQVAQVKVVEASNSPVPEIETTFKPKKHNGFESVDQLADSFIKNERKRIELARLISMKGGAI
ncbi:hypothetical protein RIF29_08554 [Crotalaria pallida]|uniref:Uncharacterized protein n=1 Tax=Crotalaria pallida TaxID=3830 RepID=A0AAN9IHD7_CROPI